MERLLAILLHALAFSLCSSLSRSRALDNGRTLRRIVCVAVHNLRASHDDIRLDAFIQVGAYSWITLQEFLIERSCR